VNAAADYAAVRKALTKPLPAYVSYVAQTHAKIGPFDHDGTEHIVVRTSDGKVLSGRTDNFQISSGGSSSPGDVVTRPVFEANCYEATAARNAQFEGKAVEALSIRYTCPKSGGDHERDFNTLYVEPTGLDPIAAVEADNDEHVNALLTQRFARFGDRVLPSVLDVRIKGSGFMAWLDITVRQSISGYAFSEHEPPLPEPTTSS
jgi:hypothetical protein